EKANPSFRYLKNLQVVMDQEYIDMQTNVQLYTEFMTKRMNMPEGNKDREVTSWENILATNQEIPDLKGATCRIGIDYAKTTDFVCSGLLFKYKEKYVWISHTWVCRNSKDLKRIKAPLEEWKKQGLLTFVDEVEIHPDIPAQWLANQAKKYNLTILGMDNFRHTLLSKSLRNIGFDTDKKGANNIKLTRPSDQMRIYPVIDSAFTNQNIIFGDNPIMRWYTNNTCLHAEKYENYTFAKIEPKSRKTDGFMAFVTAMCCDIDDLPDSAENYDYEDFGVYTY
ncbi:terminase large subunit, partial [Clostridium botulinum]|nr:terminase large subunit [Clostridium botulinum]NFP06004.1 terminase large subunit [Clostridium botulinum]NFS02295.1 terminase large subunit [Clostridium botulinum]